MYHTTQKQLAQSYMKSLTLISGQLLKIKHSTKHLSKFYLCEVMGKIQYSFSMDQLEKLEEVHPNRMSKYNTYIKDKY